MTDIQEDISEIKKMIKEIHDRLYVGNGQPPITIQLDRLNVFKKFSYWLYSALSVASLAVVSRVVYVYLTK